MSFQIAVAIKYPTGSVKVQPVEPWKGVVAMFINLMKLGIRPQKGDMITDDANTTYEVVGLLFNQSTNLITVIIE